MHRMFGGDQHLDATVFAFRLDLVNHVYVSGQHYNQCDKATKKDQARERRERERREREREEREREER